MAKAKKNTKGEAVEEKVEETTIKAPDVDSISAMINKKMGAGCIVSGAEMLDRPREVLPWSPQLDIGLNGGVPEGCWITVSGVPKCGKSTAILTLCAYAQSVGRTIVYLDVEGRMGKKEFGGIKGLDASKIKYVGPKRGDIKTSVDYFEIAGEFIKSIPGCVIVFDSLSSMLNPQVVGKELDKKDYASGYQIVGRFCDTYSNMVRVNGTIIIGVAHLYANVSGYGRDKTQKVAARWTHQMDISIMATGVKPWMASAADDAPRIGQKVTWEIINSALGPPGGKVDSYLRYGTGLDKPYETMMQAVDLGIITNAGAWYYYGEDKKWQGQEKLYRAFCDTEGFQEEVGAKIKEMTSDES